MTEKAARIDDHIQHSHALLGTLLGLGAGLLIGVAVVATGGAAGVIMATVAVAGWGYDGASIGRAIGECFDYDAGPIVTGANTVIIGRKLAARAKTDRVSCHPKPIAQGSRIVFLENFPASRMKDKTACNGQIGQGFPTVIIGKEPGTYVAIESEVPWLLEMAVEALGAISLAGNLLRGGARFLARRGLIRCPGGASRLAREVRTFVGHPVDVAMGDVVDEAVDIELPGAIPLTWKRSYCTATASEETSLGFGGWTHSLEQWVVDEGDLLAYRCEEGRDIYFARVAVGESTFHRRERLTLTAGEEGTFTIYSHATRLTRSFAPVAPGGRALLRSIRDEHANAINLYYDGEHLARVIDTAGRELRVTTDPLGRIMRVEVWACGELARFWDYAYSPGGELAYAANGLGHADRFEYDACHRMLKTTLKNGVNFYYAYDSDTGRCVRTWGDGGLRAAELEYDSYQGKTKVTGTGEPRVYFWNEDGLVVREELPDGRTLQVREVDDDQFVVAEGVTEAALTRYEYDERGRRTAETDAAGNVRRWEYDGDQPSRVINPGGLVTVFEHDARGSLSAVTYPSKLRYELAHDLHGRLVSVRGMEEGVLAQFEYDAEHNVVEEVDARGARTTFTYDPAGLPLSQRDALGRETRIEYDAIGQPIATYMPDGTVTRAEYEPLGNIKRVIDALGQVTELEYAGTGTLTTLAQPDGQVWNMEYDRDERLIEIRNPADERYDFGYDAGGRVVRERTFDGRTLRYRYSDEGNLHFIEYPDQTFRILKHDALGNVVSDDTLDSGIVFDRDKQGRVQQAILKERSGKAIVAFKRDELGRVVAETQNGQTIQYEYDARGQRTARVMPDGSTTKYDRDVTGALVGLEHNGYRVAIERDALGRETLRRSEGGQVSIRSAYDAMDRLIERHVAGGAAHALLSRRTWTYDALGRVQEIGDSRWGPTVYKYDAIGQLIEAARGSRREVFRYDVTGSLRKILEDVAQGEQSRAWSTAPGNLLLETDKVRYEYDRRGRRVKRVQNVDVEGARAGEVTEYVWDQRDRLREVKRPDGSRVLFTYDAFGRRTRKEVVPGEGGGGPKRVVEFLWDEDELAADTEDTHRMRVFVHEPGTFVPVLQAEQGEVFSVVNDHLGTPKELIDEEGRVAWSAAHSAWGKVVEEFRDPLARRKRAVESPFRLLGQYADEETGLCYTRFRYFDAEAGRWCSPDPLEIDGGLNLSGFDGAPTSDVDPLGLKCRGVSGRARRHERLRQIAQDPRTSSAHRGWIKQEQNAIARGQRKNIRVPPGTDLAHSRGREAAKGFDHVASQSQLQERNLHRLQHRYDDFGRANKERR
jgi:RHS repeat-associated protein